MKLTQITKNDINDYFTQIPPMSFVILFGGDRLSVCDWGLVATIDGQFGGLVTYSESGEMGEGASIVGLWVAPQFRKRGVGTALLKSVQQFANKTDLKVSAITHSGLKTVQKVEGLIVSNMSTPFELQ